MKKINTCSQKPDILAAPIEMTAYTTLLLNTWIPEIKQLAQAIKKYSSTISKINRQKQLRSKRNYILHGGMDIVAKMYSMYPRYLVEVDDNLSDLIQRSLSADEIDFFLKCHENLKKTAFYKNLQKEEIQNDYGGQCFKAAYVFMLRHKEIPKLILVHGWVYNPCIEKYMPHAWVEENETLIHDLSQDLGAREISRNDFYGLARSNIKHLRFYSFEQMNNNAKQTGHYGPWDQTLFALEFLSVEEFQSL